jgi:hypothetical protein
MIGPTARRQESNQGLSTAETNAAGPERAESQARVGQAVPEPPIDVQAIADKVYELMRRECAIERERIGSSKR